jgi:aspartate racemase
MSAIPMGLSLQGYETGDHRSVARHLAEGVRQVAKAGADFYVCPDNTAHIVLETIAAELPLPGLHIADVVCGEIAARGFRHVGLLGTKWTMTGPVYRKALEKRELPLSIPDEPMREELNRAIFEELVEGVFKPQTTARFLSAIDDLKARGADCVILGCTEIPLIVTAANASLPVLDSTRLLARQAVVEAISPRPIPIPSGWLP